MCGIAGFIDTQHRLRQDELDEVAVAMASALRHRGPDDEGAWSDAGAGVALGHRRLSIIDVSPHGHQPMLSRSGRFVVSYNGEMYNYRAVRRRLEKDGAGFRGGSDTEVLVEAIDRYGVTNALETFDGMFALAIWDRKRRRLTLARDRMGEKPLYYGWAGSWFLFASECKAFRAHPGFHGDVDRDSLTLFLRHNYVPAPYSIYRGIYKLLPGTTLEIDPHAVGNLPVPACYWTLGDTVRDGLHNRVEGTVDDMVDALHDSLRAAVESRMVSDVPLGAFLSGGIDSSTVVAFMQAASDRPVKTFTIGFNESGFDEAQHAKAVAGHLATDHTELYVTPSEAQRVIPQLSWIYDEPFADSSQIPTYLISSLARRDVKVALSGDGGDELFGGYTRYVFHRSLWRRLSTVPIKARENVARALLSVSPATWDSVGRRLDRLLPRRIPRDQLGDKIHKFAAVIQIAHSEDVYRNLTSHWDSPASVVLGGREPQAPTSISDAWQLFDNGTDAMMYLDALTYLPDDILAKVDRASMATSLEARVPLLDHKVVELAWRLPSDVKIRGDEGKWILRQVLNRYVPQGLVDRPKMGFGVPIGAWLRGPLRDWAEHLLSPTRLAQEGYFDVAAIRARWDDHLAGTRDWKYHLWDVLMFQGWLDASRQEAGELDHSMVAYP